MVDIPLIRSVLDKASHSNFILVNDNNLHAHMDKLLIMLLTISGTNVLISEYMAITAATPIESIVDIYAGLRSHMFMLCISYSKNNILLNSLLGVITDYSY